MLLKLCFLFMIGSLFGWVLELFYRRFISAANPERKWINPGFCVGPYLPLYGSGLCLLYLIALLDNIDMTGIAWLNKVIIFIVMAVTMTLIEFIAGIISLKVYHVRLWDYRKEWGNIMGLICPKYSFFWAVLGALYYFFINPFILGALDWLSANLIFSFFIGAFFGIFGVDAVYSLQIVHKVKKFAEEKGIIVKYEALRKQIKDFQEKEKEKAHWFLSLKTNRPLKNFIDELQDISEKIKSKVSKKKNEETKNQ